MPEALAEDYIRDARKTWGDRKSPSPPQEPLDAHEYAQRYWWALRALRIALRKQERSLHGHDEILLSSVPGVGNPEENLSQVLDELISLTRDEEPEAKPSPYAYRRAWEVISTAGQLIGHDFPFGYVMEDGEHGVRVEWQNGPKHVRLSIPSVRGGREYIYYEDADMHGIRELSGMVLSAWLLWLAI